MSTLNRNSIPSISASDFEVFRAAKMARNPRITIEPLPSTSTNRKRKTCSFPFSTPSMGYRENTTVYSFTPLQTLNESALIAFLAATMSFIEPLQVQLKAKLQENVFCHVSARLGFLQTYRRLQSRKSRLSALFQQAHFYAPFSASHYRTCLMVCKATGEQFFL